MKSFKQYITEASFGHTLWIDPKGKVYDMNSRKEITDPKGHAYTHYDWVNANFDKYFGKLDPKSDEVYNKPMEMGWARIRNGRVSLDVEVNIKKLNRSQKKVIRSIVDTNHKRPLYIDSWVKNKTSRAGDLGFDNYDDVVDFLSEAASYRGDMLIGWIDPKNKLILHPEGGRMGRFHTQILTNMMSVEEFRKFQPDRIGVGIAKDMVKFVKSGDMTEAQLKHIIDKSYENIYNSLKSGKSDGDYDTEENLEKAGWVKVRIDRKQNGRSSVLGKLDRCQVASKVIDKKFGGWRGINTDQFWVMDGGTMVADEKTWDTYIKTGRIPKRTEIGQTMSKFR